MRSTKMMREQRFQSGGWGGQEVRTGWRDLGVFQRRELVGMQSQRALLSALSTSISVCRGQHREGH